MRGIHPVHPNCIGIGCTYMDDGGEPTPPRSEPRTDEWEPDTDSEHVVYLLADLFKRRQMTIGDSFIEARNFVRKVRAEAAHPTAASTPATESATNLTIRRLIADLDECRATAASSDALHCEGCRSHAYCRGIAATPPSERPRAMNIHEQTCPDCQRVIADEQKDYDAAHPATDIVSEPVPDDVRRRGTGPLQRLAATEGLDVGQLLAADIVRGQADSLTGWGHRDEHGNPLPDYHVCGCRPATEGLDVERLSRAIFSVADDERYDLSLTRQVHQLAKAAAAEYARLSSPEGQKK